jgi:hypothetical protein
VAGTGAFAGTGRASFRLMFICRSVKR